ncbi:zinc finger protein Paris-like [Drosophila kikkawai]|uniref:Zinc finger protein Paris-like n=1 Tax=Drosophila kikkawai TaxID=30033 RepID=A0A6P4JDJ5_DROKI|nr:zinc finger protein 302-like [Drosophila kikkawai]
MEDITAVASPRIRSLRNRAQKCRVCLKKSKEMVNIFDISPEHCVPIADLLSQYTRLEIFKGDSYPETVCPPCLQAAKNAFEIKQDPEGIIDITQDESGVQVKNEGIDNVFEESAPQMEYFLIDEFLSDEVKPDQTEEYYSGNVMNEEPPEEYFSGMNEEPPEEHFSGQVINEPIDDDSLGEDAGESLDYEIDPSYLREQSQGTDEDNNDNNGESNSVVFPCSCCPTRFTKRCQRMPTYKCPHCTKSFKYESFLQQHIRKHTGERPFKCSQCQKDFTTQQQFSLHFKSHPQTQIFKCSHCGLVFSKLEEHEAHLKTHIKKKIKCFNSQKHFSSARKLNNHIEISHKKIFSEKRYTCLYCKMSFRRRESLLLHLKGGVCISRLTKPKIRISE